MPCPPHLFAESQSADWQQGYAAGKKELQDALDAALCLRWPSESIGPTELAEKNELIDVIEILRRAVGGAMTHGKITEDTARRVVHAVEHRAWCALVAASPDDEELRADEPFASIPVV